MPFRSAKQKKWMKINRPDIYKKWKNKYGIKITKTKKGQSGRRK